jgi:hypothetical protein
MRYLIVSLALLFVSSLLVTNVYMPVVIRQAPPTATFVPTAPQQSQTFTAGTPTPFVHPTPAPNPRLRQP